MMRRGPPLPARLKQQSIRDDESITYDGNGQLVDASSSDDDWHHVEDERQTSSRRTRSASPPGMILPLSYDQTQYLLRADELENASDGVGEYSLTEDDTEDDDSQEHGVSIATEDTRNRAHDTSREGPPRPPQIVSKVDPGKKPAPKTSGYWRYDQIYGDYVQRLPGGRIIGYREYQRRGQLTTAPPAEPRVIDKPKRFYSFGRIFKLIWVDFSPDGKSVPRPRWFVVVRRRLHHSLCFAITTGGGAGLPGIGNGRPRGGRGVGGNPGHRGRPKDFVVLFPAGFPPPAPDEDEGVERDPVGVIIEDAEQCISPQARLDCARIYTVEFDVAVVKIGRVDTRDFPKLEEYYQECVK